MSSADKNISYEQALSSKLRELSEEAMELSQRKLEYDQHIKNIELRLAHIVGAIQALDSILNKDK